MKTNKLTDLAVKSMFLNFDFWVFLSVKDFKSIIRIVTLIDDIYFIKLSAKYLKFYFKYHNRKFFSGDYIILLSTSLQSLMLPFLYGGEASALPLSFDVKFFFYRKFLNVFSFQEFLFIFNKYQYDYFCIYLHICLKFLYCYLYILFYILIGILYKLKYIS